MINTVSTDKSEERAVLVAVLNFTEASEEEERMAELAFLAETAGAKTVKTIVQKMNKPNGRTFIGSGKLKELKEVIADTDANLVIFDDEISPSQLRNLEKELEVKILDRTSLILDIFALRACTSQAKIQVELAQYQYLLPRITRMWTHLERQAGGIGVRGPGESQIETDRRIIKQKISLLKSRLLKIDCRTNLQRKNRRKVIRIALVGYTNAGKSTLMNLLSGSDVFAENKLFATLDTTVRSIKISEYPVLLSDTVGFIRKLPHSLVESFKSTLAEVLEADILMHVVDISGKNFDHHIETVNNTLYEIGAVNKEIIMVFNKSDAFQDEEGNTLEDFKSMWIAKNQIRPFVFISALKKINIDLLKDILNLRVKTLYENRWPYKSS